MSNLFLFHRNKLLVRELGLVRLKLVLEFPHFGIGQGVLLLVLLQLLLDFLDSLLVEDMMYYRT